MTTRDNAPPPCDWQPEPKPCDLDHACTGCAPTELPDTLRWDGDDG